MYVGRVEFADLFEHCRMDNEFESEELPLNAMKTSWYIPISLPTLFGNE